MNQASTTVPTAMAQDFMREITNYEPLLLKLSLDLQRKEVTFDKDGNMKVVQHGEPRVKEEGVRDIVSRVRSVLNTNTAYSYTTEDDFRNTMKANACSLVIRIWAKRRDWGIEASDYSVICRTVMDMMDMAMRKAIGKNFQDFTSSSKTSQETIIMESQQKSGFLGGIFGPSQKKGW